MIDRNTKFRPVYGTETQILNTAHEEGYVYVAKDSGKIFLYADGNLKQIGGSGSGGGSGTSSIFWANGDEDENTLRKATEDASDGDPVYYFHISAIEGGKLPDNDALVLNSDGRFFRVTDNGLDSEQFFEVELIAVSGGGSGGGGGGGGTSTDQDLSIEWDNIELLNSSYIHGKSQIIKFFPHSDADETVYISILARDNSGNTPDIEDSDALYNGDVYEFDTAQLPLSNNITITVLINSDHARYNRGKGLTKEFKNIKTLEMGIRKVSNRYLHAINDADDLGMLTLDYVPIGPSNEQMAQNFTETLHVEVDGEEIIGLRTLLNKDDFGISHQVTINRQEHNINHGVHNIELYVSTEINRNTIESDRINFQAAWVVDGDNTPLIWFGDYPETVINYENASIPYMIYNPADVANANHESSILLFKDGEQISENTVRYSSNDWLYWDISEIYTVNAQQEVTPNVFGIQLGIESKSVTVNITTKGSRKLDIQPAGYLLINLSAAGRSNSELKSNRNQWPDKGRKNAQVQLNGFNWANNGWQSPQPSDADYSSGAYLTIANGASVTIPMDPYIVNGDTDYSFEFRFKVRNVQQYSTLVTSEARYFYKSLNPETGVWTEHNTPGDSKTMKEIEQNPNWEVLYNYGTPWDDEENVLDTINIEKGVICTWVDDIDPRSCNGFVIGTQEAFFKSTKKLVRVRYKDDQILNLSFVISRTDQTAYIFLNGVPAGAAPLPINNNGQPDGWRIQKNLVFNSEYCDIDLYRVRFFQCALSTPQVIHNYLSDKHDIQLYDQNQLTKVGHDNLLDYNLLVQYNENNPNNLTMPYATWKITGGDNEILPYYKGNNRLCDVHFVNPTADKLLEDGEITAWEYYTHVPSFDATGVDINVQGTSSQEYPRRNYKQKYKKATSWVFTKGPLAGQSVAKDHYFNIETIDGKQVPTTWVGATVEKQGKTELDADYKTRMKAYKKLGKKLHIDTETVATNKFTWKIDYMESSGTYNTGFANLMGNKNAPLYNKHPLEDIGIDATEMRTSVYGFPVLTFHEFANGTYEYIGRYNMNLDKSSNEYYGFEKEVEQPYLDEVWDEYAEVKVRDPITHEVIKDEKGNDVTENVFQKTHQHPWVSQISECWEMKDNQGYWCSLKFPNDETRMNGFDTRRGADGSEAEKLEMTRHYEVRYNPSADPIEAILGETLSYNDTVDDEFLPEVGANRAAHNHYLRKKFYNLERLIYWTDSTNVKAATNEPIVNYMAEMDPNTGDVTITQTPVASVEYITAKDYTGYLGATSERTSGGYRTTFTLDTRDYRLEKFRNEFTQHFDLHYCLVYFILTELLLCYDSRGKNMMLATFGPHETGGEYVWYPIFYDIDTQLGLNNSGSYLWDYDAENTAEGIFSTSGSVLWNNLYDVFYDSIIDEYRILRGLAAEGHANQGKLIYQNIVGAYECNPEVFKSYAMAGVRPIIAMGLDEYYKYFATTTASGIGFYTTTGELTFEATPSYAYCCQGDKLLTTELLLNNRLNYIDSKWLAGDYTEAKLAQSSLTLRVTFNNPTKTSDNYLAYSAEDIERLGLTGDYVHGDYPVPYFDTVAGFKIKPFLKQYVTYYVDQASAPPTKFSDTVGEKDGVWTQNIPSIEEAALHTYGGELQDQILKVPGADYISSLGDLSVSYISRLIFLGGKRLLDLILGSDVPGYKNDGWDPSQVQFYASRQDSKNKPLLRKVVFSQMTKMNNGLDFSGSSKLNEFRALGTQLTGINFAPGAPLKIVHLPETLTSFAVEEASDLTKLITSRPVVGDYDAEHNVYTYRDSSTYEGLYLEGVTDLDYENVSPVGHTLSTLNIVGGNLKYGSYIILRNLVALKKNAPTLNTLKINLEDVDWTPYEAVEYGEPQGAGPYYLLTEHSTYVPYTDNNVAQWTNLTLNQKIYTKNTTIDTSAIDSLDILETFIRDYQGNNNFTNCVNTVAKTYPYISGNLYVDNENGDPIDEVKLTDVYKVIWPDLNIQAANIKEAYIAKYVQRLDSGRDNEIDVLRYSKPEDPSVQVHPEMTSKQVSKQNYDFKGWTLDPTKTIVNYDEVDNLIASGVILDTEAKIRQKTFSSANDTFVFYAVFSITSYNINFLNSNDDVLYIDKVNYGSHLRLPSVLPSSPEESSLSETERYKFIGWVLDKADCYPKTERQAKVQDITKIISQNNDRTFYACYLVEDCLTNVTDQQYFDCQPTDFTDGNGQTINGYYIKVKSGVQLSGKITLPTTYNGSPIISIASNGFSNDAGNKITHIYWYGEPQIRKISEGAFQNCTALIKFDLPEKTEEIAASAFTGCSNLRVLDFASSNLRVIGGYAFNAAMTNGNERLDVLHLPGSLYEVGNFAFAYMTFKNGISKLQFGGPGDPTQLGLMGDSGFQADRPANRYGDVEFYVSSSTNQEVLNSFLGWIGFDGTVSFPNA